MSTIDEKTALLELVDEVKKDIGGQEKKLLTNMSAAIYEKIDSVIQGPSEEFTNQIKAWKEEIERIDHELTKQQYKPGTKKIAGVDCTIEEIDEEKPITLKKQKEEIESKIKESRNFFENEQKQLISELQEITQIRKELQEQGLPYIAIIPTRILNTILTKYTDNLAIIRTISDDGRIPNAEIKKNHEIFNKIITKNSTIQRFIKEKISRIKNIENKILEQIEKGNIEVCIGLPKAPEDIQKILLQYVTQGYKNLYPIVEEKAISIKRIFLKKTTWWGGERNYEEDFNPWLRGDEPIICKDYDLNTVIICQYGKDLEIEQAIIQQIEDMFCFHKKVNCN